MNRKAALGIWPSEGTRVALSHGVATDKSGD